MIARRLLSVKQKPQSFLHPRKIAENRRKTQKTCKFNLQIGCGLDRQNDLECAPRSAGKVTACLQRAGTLRWARGREGCSDSPLPTSGLHPPRNATTATAASGGNREELLGQRPARRACRPRHDADAGCRNPEEAEAIPNCFTFQPAPCLQIEFAAFLRFTAIFSNFTAM